jgi:hypothetical protein
MFSPDDPFKHKFDIQLEASQIRERRLHEIFTALKLEKIELKTETHQWEETGNICIEYRQNGHRSGIAITDADCWVHELRAGGKTLCYQMFDIDVLKALARGYMAKGWYREGRGDAGLSDFVLIPLSQIMQWAEIAGLK